MQRVRRARVSVEGRETGSIGPGLLVLVGVSQDDDPEQARWTADKIANLRIFRDVHDRMNLSVAEVGGEALVVSQFTLYGDARKGRRPSFVRAAQGEEAKALYEEVVTALRGSGIPVATGEFGAMMNVELVNEGPVTILLDSERKF